VTKKVGFELRACLNVVMNMTAEEAEIGGGGVSVAVGVVLPNQPHESSRR